MAASEDEIAKQQVKEAVWTWAGRILVIAVAFGFGFFSAWLLWGSGVEGAPRLRAFVKQQEDQIRDLKNQRADIQGKFTVVEGRLSDCQKALSKARSGTP